jgi:Flp pilus assembly pilin Flp
VTDSYAYTLDQFRPGYDSRIARGTRTSGSTFTRRSAGATPARSSQPSHPVKEVNRMLKLFIAGQTYAMGKLEALRENEEGQTMAEYGVVLAVITMGVVIALTTLGTEITGALGRVTDKLKP